MPSFQDLPDELLKHTLSFLVAPEAPQWQIWHEFQTEQIKGNYPDHEEDQNEGDGVASLYSLCLVSKRFRDIAQPLLFLDFSDDGVLGNTEETVRFANCLYRYPELGQFVQDVTICRPFFFDDPDEEAFNEPLTAELSEEDIEIYMRAIKELNLGAEEEKWISAMKECNLAVFAALVLNKTPNLRRLIIPGGLDSLNPYTHLFRHNPSFLHRLECLGVMGKDEYDGHDITSYSDFFALPNLKIAMIEDGDLQSTTNPVTWEPGSFNIKELIFHGCVLDGPSMSTFIRACKDLKYFLFDNFKAHVEITDRPQKGSMFNAADAHKALLDHKETLEYMRVDLPRSERDLEDWQRFISSRAKMGPLRDFTALKSIRIQQALVSVHPQLPPALKKLSIPDCNSSVINLVKNIAKDCKKGLYPDFVDFKMFAPDITQPIQLPGQVIPEGKTPAQAHEALVDLFIGTNVNFLIAPSTSSPDDFMDEYDDDDDFDDDFDDGFDDGFDDDFDDEEELDLERLRETMINARLGAGGRGGAGRGAARGGAARGGSTRGGAGRGGPGPNGPMPPELLDYFMNRAMQDPDFAHLFPQPAGGSRRAPGGPRAPR
ncbi:hypothetical protein N7478_011969 [Penicillium angulare]|uniref:uncharacterized protein n=1 Tax=Penicillium angulare TaxID=116970 RepID=UPI0025425BE4|nr:uncharacterized protein N7478_011969 [Penicillium angulare]KAJ5261374.1 hypothetical protein N7478_011969 [Penicillium angulare]